MADGRIIIDGNEAAARVAYALSELAIIYPITPSSPMGELSDLWSSQSIPNILGDVPDVIEMQSEGGASGAVHGAIQAGSLTSTFTASQGLLLMIPNMYKIAGELSPAVFHVAARSVAAQALSIFGDHSDVMATRQTGFCMLSSASIQEAHDFALIAHAAAIESSLPFLHFFDGFRTSHELNTISELDADTIKQFVDVDRINYHRSRKLTPDKPVLRGTAQNPDVFFQARESVNKYYDQTPAIVEKLFQKFKDITGREYFLFEYVGSAQAEKLIIVMGSGAETAHETVDYLNDAKLGILKVRLYRPFSIKHFIEAVPETVRQVTVLDRTKEPGAPGEPLYLDVVNAFQEAYADGLIKSLPVITGGRYGLSSKEFTPAMVKAVFDELDREKPRNHFTVGIHDDVTMTSLLWDVDFSTEDADTFRGIFYGLGSDGTVSANKSSIKIIGSETDYQAQGYFVYDSKKSGSVTKSHLRFGKKKIRSAYLIEKANFIAVHHFNFLEKVDPLAYAEENGTFLLNTEYSAEDVWDRLPQRAQKQIISKKLKFYIIDAYKVAEKTGMGVRINTIMQTAFFKIAGIMPIEKAVEAMKVQAEKQYGKRGEEIVRRNYTAIDAAVDYLYEVKVPDRVGELILPPVVSEKAPDFVQNVLQKMMVEQGDSLPVSALPDDGTYPTGTARWEKRNIAKEIPLWDPDVCIQCGKCSLVCPHATIRAKVYGHDELNNAPEGFLSAKPKGKFEENTAFTIQVAPEDCTGCTLCVEICPAKNKSDTSLKAINMVEQAPIREREAEYWDFFTGLPEYNRDAVKKDTVKGTQLLEPLFEFSGACSGCGETPYIKLATQLFGDRMLIANATGCSSIYGGNLPTTPYTVNKDGRGPAWSNSLFEDNAEFGLGMRTAFDRQRNQALRWLNNNRDRFDSETVDYILNNNQKDEADIYSQREAVEKVRQKLDKNNSEDRFFDEIADALVKKSVWIIGGDGWAYDIGYGGLDHVLASGLDVNILVLDTEVYSNTGGQMSKATPLGAVAKFAAGGKRTGKKDLALMAMEYGNVYVGKVAMGANDTHTIRTFLEAERYEGPSIIIAYSHCIAHGYNLKYGLRQQKLAEKSGYWPLLRYNPERADENKNPFQLDSKEPSVPLSDYIYNETRYKMLTKMQPEIARSLADQAQREVKEKYQKYKQMAAATVKPEGETND